MVDCVKDPSKSLYHNSTPELAGIVDSSTIVDSSAEADSRLERLLSGYSLKDADPKYSASGQSKYRHFKDTIETKFRDVKDAVIENKAANLASLGGLALSLATNYISGTYAGEHHMSYSGIDWTSFIFEVIPHATTSGIIMYKTYRNQGLSRKDTLKNMGVVLAVTTALTFSLYKPLRDVLSNHFLDLGNPAGLATLKAQLSLMAEYILVSSTVSYLTLKAFKRLPKDLLSKEQKKKDILTELMQNMAKVDESNDETRKVVDEVTKDYFKQNPVHRKNGNLVINPEAI